jgi:D-methionine transport system permease protein
MRNEKLIDILVDMLPLATAETLLMTLASVILASLMGLPLGVYLFSSSPAGLNPKQLTYNVVSRIVNILRSLPFIILMILLIPITKFLVGTSIGSGAAIVPLSIAAAPFIARVVETALLEVDTGVITAARAMGSSNFQIIRKVLIPESLPSLVSGLALTIINLIGYSAMAGAIGGGGLGALAINYGYYRFRTDVTIAAVVVIIILVELVQFICTAISHKLLSKR